MPKYFIEPTMTSDIAMMTYEEAKSAEESLRGEFDRQVDLRDDAQEAIEKIQNRRYLLIKRQAEAMRESAK